MTRVTRSRGPFFLTGNRAAQKDAAPVPFWGGIGGTASRQNHEEKMHLASDVLKRGREPSSRERECYLDDFPLIRRTARTGLAATLRLLVGWLPNLAHQDRSHRYGHVDLDFASPRRRTACRRPPGQRKSQAGGSCLCEAITSCFRSQTASGRELQSW